METTTGNLQKHYYSILLLMASHINPTKKGQTRALRKRLLAKNQPLAQTYVFAVIRRLEHRLHIVKVVHFQALFCSYTRLTFSTPPPNYNNNVSANVSG